MNSNEKPTRQKVADEFGFLEGLVSERTYGMIVDNVMDILPPLVEGEWVMVKDTGWTEAAKPAAQPRASQRQTIFLASGKWSPPASPGRRK